MEKIVLAGGCYWGTQAYLQRIRGVVSTRVGFANGHTANPSYREVYTDTTGHAEVVEVVFDPAILGLSRLLELYFAAIDPLSLNRQGEDRGRRYRTGIYTTQPEQEPVCRAMLAVLSATLGQPTAVELAECSCFYPAEEDHQFYLDKNPDGYCHLPLSAFAAATKAAVWPETLVPTATGAIPAAALGKTLAHEHIVCYDFRTGKDYSGIYGKKLEDRAVALLLAAKAEGYTALYDATPYGLGRSVPLLETVSRATGVAIVPACGCYWFNKPELDALSREELVQKLTDTAKNGFPGSSVRPGLLKCAVQETVTPRHRQLLTGIAAAHRETGLPVIMHTCRKTAAEATEILLGEGVPPDKLTVGHTGDYFDPALQLSLAEKGVFLGIDRTFTDPEERAEAVAALCRAGYAGRLLLSHDRAVFMDFNGYPDTPEALLEQQCRRELGDRHFLWLEDTLLPLLRQRGVTTAQLAEMQYHNPRRFLEKR